jgi:hypothetical protein
MLEKANQEIINAEKICSYLKEDNRYQGTVILGFDR